MAASMLSQVRSVLLRFEARLLASLTSNFSPNLVPALALDESPESSHDQNTEPMSEQANTSQSLIDDILGNGILWASVPKHRRTAEKRASRRMSLKGHREEYLPKKDIVACLECGHWHQKHTICGHCYEKVREETKAMQEAMGEDRLRYDAPHSEVVVLYEGEQEEAARHQGKYVVEMNKKRPEWFPKELMTKPNRR